MYEIYVFYVLQGPQVEQYSNTDGAILYKEYF